MCIGEITEMIGKSRYKTVRVSQVSHQMRLKNKTEIIRKVLAFRPCPNFDPDEPEFLEPADVVMPMPVLK